MGRISVYVPDAMRRRMDALGDRVNWSEVAQEAFELEISKAKIPKGAKMSQVIERLRASKDKFEKDEAEKGRQDGRNWAMSRASYEQLTMVSELELSGSDYARQFDHALGNSSGNWRDSFWADIGADQWPSDSYVDAFVDGANDIWNEVADKL